VSPARKGAATRRWPVVQAVGLLWESSPLDMTLASSLLVLATLAGVASTVVNGLMVGAIPSALRGGGLSSPGGRHLVTLLVLTALVGLMMFAVGQTQGFVLLRLRWRWTSYLRRRAMSAALDPPGLAHMEDPAFRDELTLAMSTPGSSPVQIPEPLFTIAGQRLGGISQAVILAQFHLWAALLLAAAMMAQNAYGNKELDLLFHFYGTVTPEMRRSDYYRGLAMAPATAKELRVFGLAGWLVDGFTLPWLETMRGVWAKRRALWWRMLAQGAFELVAFGAVFLAIARSGAQGAIGLGAMTIYLGAANGMRGLGMVGDSQYMLRNGANSLPHLTGISRLPSVARAAMSGTRAAPPGSPASRVAFEGVTFSYPGTNVPVFEGLDLVLEAGSSTAIVGVNGAGKTTLVKLLARLYDPDAGRVTVDGVDLAEIDPESWHRRVAVVFQDFVKYPFSAWDNVAVGGRSSPSPEEIEAVAHLAGVDEVVGGLGDGWQTLLSKTFKDGTDLSGGEWQKIALARGLLAARSGGVLVLDEPTAALDVRSEAAFFDRFLDLTAGSTAIVISHRFSTVRRAQRICVLSGGRVVEDGTHEELLGLGGEYARMFRLQADRFAGADPELQAGRSA
jgi:ATP-binding cassette subfamily B protein